jgi:TPP-dependent 2-oxoacid decarboxylase
MVGASSNRCAARSKSAALIWPHIPPVDGVYARFCSTDSGACLHPAFYWPSRRPTDTSPVNHTSRSLRIAGTTIARAASLLSGDVISEEDGTSSAGSGRLTLPEECTCLSGAFIWCSIGHATGALLGAILASPGRRHIWLTGEGSLQVTAQAISTFMRMTSSL